jgi:hypothetical protein
MTINHNDREDIEDEVVYALCPKYKEYIRLKKQAEVSQQASLAALSLWGSRRTDELLGEYIAAQFKWEKDSNACDVQEFRLREDMDAEEQSQLH